MINIDQIKELESLLPNKISTDHNTLEHHGNNQFYISDKLPDAVCFAESEQDVLILTNFCIKNRIPIIPYGSGTSVEGHIAAVHGGISLDLSKMNKVLEVNLADGYVIVQPGISYNALNEALKDSGYHFPVEAGYGASIGGMVATNASGAGATDSGSMSKNIVECDVVVYKGGEAAKIHLGTKAPKSSAGYNLLGLFAGSEGTLGIITKVGLKIRKNFSYSKTICCQFNELEQAINFVIDMKGLIHFRRVELLDTLQTKACITYSDIKTLYPDMYTIILELGGNEAAVAEEISLISDYLNRTNVEFFKIYDDKNSSETIWKMRKNACPAAISYIDINKKAIATDISVPMSKLAECIKICYGHMKNMGLTAPLVAHIGDGNFHFTILVDKENEFEMQRAKEFNNKIVSEALKLGGTCTGEHGIGLGKKELLEAEHGDNLFMYQIIKQAFDPLNIFNPGKILSLTNTMDLSNEKIKDCTQHAYSSKCYSFV